MNAVETAELLAAINEIKPIIEKALPVLSEVGTLVKPVVEGLCDFKVELTDRMVNDYVSREYTREEAIALVINDMQMMSNIGKK